MAVKWRRQSRWNIHFSSLVSNEPSTLGNTSERKKQQTLHASSWEQLNEMTVEGKRLSKMKKCNEKYNLSLRSNLIIFTFFHLYLRKEISSSPLPPMAQQPPSGQGLLIINSSRLHSETPHSVGLLWTSDQPDAETSTWQHTTLTTDKHPCPQRDSSLQSQQASGRRPTPYRAATGIGKGISYFY